MEWTGLIALALVLCYSSYPGKVKRLEAALQMVGSTEVLCKVLDTDDEWMKICYTDKKKNQVIKLLRIENIDEIEIVKAENEK